MPEPNIKMNHQRQPNLDRRSADVIFGRLEVLESGHTELKHAIDANTIITTQIQRDTSELVALFKTAKGGYTTFGWITTMVIKFSAVLTAIGVIWALVYHFFKR